MRILPRYTAEFKADALELLERTNRSMPEVARDLGVSVYSLRTWYKNALVAKKKNKRPSKGAPVSATAASAGEPLGNEVEQLRRELKQAHKRIADLEMDRDILKKAAAFFAKESE